jgi:hypothetical protein
MGIENNEELNKSKTVNGKSKNKIGLGEGLYSFPEDIDASNDEIAEMFYGDEKSPEESDVNKKIVQISKEDFLLNPNEYLKRAETEDVFIMEGTDQKVAIVLAEKYNAYRPVGREFDWYNWK